MVLDTPVKWFSLAQRTIPQLPGYMREFGLEVTETQEELNNMLAEKDHVGLYKVFNECWQLLPDHPKIRHHPFFDLCDLCSEIWVFDNDDGQDQE